MDPVGKPVQTISILVIFLALSSASLWAQEQRGVQEFLTLWAGMLPIILSAPHGGRQLIPGISARRGIGVAQFATGRDNNTDELAEKIAGKIEHRLGTKPFLVVARFERKYVDVNRPKATAYETAEAAVYYDSYHHALESACAQARKDWGRAVLLDIHGQGFEGETIFRGTDNGKSVTDLQQRFGREALTGEKSIMGQLKLRGYRIAPGPENDREYRYTGGYTTQTYGSHRGTSIDAIQLEFGAKLRSRANLDQTAADLAEGILAFAQVYLPVKRVSVSAPAEAHP